MTWSSSSTSLRLMQRLTERARKLAPDHALRGYDAVHLAAATMVGADVFTSADSALCDAAAREGMLVANPLD